MAGYFGGGAASASVRYVIQSLSLLRRPDLSDAENCSAAHLFELRAVVGGDFGRSRSASRYLGGEKGHAQEFAGDVYKEELALQSSERFRFLSRGKWLEQCRS